MQAQPPEIREQYARSSSDRAGFAVVAIVIHCALGTDSPTAWAVNPMGLSTHYLVPKSGDPIYRMVAEGRAAHYARSASCSLALAGRAYQARQVEQATVSIALESMQTGRDDYDDCQLLSLGYLVNDIRSRHGDLPVLRRADLDPEQARDPLHLTVNMVERWANAAMLVYGRIMQAAS
jgi:N-acetyl-anhydromuramyl-L-alanine amidase AmpD